MYVSCSLFPRITTNVCLDPVPYLDILGMSEGCILLVCASLPALGPLIHAARGKLSDSYGSGQGSRNQLDDSSHSRSRGMDSKWDNFKGHKLDDPEHSSGARASIDAIPLVSASKSNQLSRNHIHRTVEVSVSTESLGDKSQHAGPAPSL